MINIRSKTDTQVLVYKNIKAFVELLWSKYQPCIIKKVFLPFIIYMIIFIYISSFLGVDLVSRYDRELNHIGVVDEK